MSRTSPGGMQLIPRAHHQAPGPVQETLHPGARAEWSFGEVVDRDSAC